MHRREPTYATTLAIYLQAAHLCACTVLVSRKQSRDLLTACLDGMNRAYVFNPEVEVVTQESYVSTRQSFPDDIRMAIAFGPGDAFYGARNLNLATAGEVVDALAPFDSDSFGAWEA